MILEGCYFERMNSPGLQCGVICHVPCLNLCTVFAREMSMALFPFNEIVQFVPKMMTRIEVLNFPLPLVTRSVHTRSSMQDDSKGILNSSSQRHD
jgi:hypothetical protein